MQLVHLMVLLTIEQTHYLSKLGSELPMVNAAINDLLQNKLLFEYEEELYLTKLGRQFVRRMNQTVAVDNHRVLAKEECYTLILAAWLTGSGIHYHYKDDDVHSNLVSLGLLSRSNFINPTTTVKGYAHINRICALPI